MVVFGGYNNGAYTSNTQLLSLKSDPPLWVAMHPGGTTPSPRAYASAVFDPDARRMLLVGGENAIEGIFNSSYSLRFCTTPSLEVGVNNAAMGRVDRSDPTGP
jgi:hypothetical protein